MIICQRQSCVFPKWRSGALLIFSVQTDYTKADELFRISTEKRILFGTRKYFNLKSLTGIKLRYYFYQTMLCLTIVCTCNVRVYIGWYSCTLWKSQTWLPSIEINCSVCYSFSITLKYFYLFMLMITSLDALLPFYRIHFSTPDLFSIVILKQSLSVLTEYIIWSHQCISSH